MDFWIAISQTGIFQKVLFLILGIFSFVSWALFFYYRSAIRRISFQDKRFEKIFDMSTDLTAIDSKSKSHRGSLISHLFKEVYAEFLIFVKRNGKQGTVLKSREDLQCLERVFDVSLRNEISKLSHKLRWLATIGSTAPFIGLLGTVVGIIRAFTDIGKVGSASLVTVAPGIAEALIMTAVGLVVAIPAVVFFNDVKGHLNRRQEEANRFGAHMINAFQKSFLNK
jgi:biopolymer transport protein TolQ